MQPPFLPCRWFQFRLRTMLVLVGLTAVAAAWFGSERRAWQREESAFRAIMHKGGSILARPESSHVMFNPIYWCPTSDGKSRHLNGSSSLTFGDADLHLLDDVRHLIGVSFARSHVSVDGARHFQRKHPSCFVSHPDFPESKNHESPINSIPENPGLEEPRPEDSKPVTSDNAPELKDV